MESLVAVSAVLGTGYAGTILSNCLYEFPKEELEPRIKSTQLIVTTIGCLIWPAIFIILLNKEWKSGVLVKDKLMWACALWVMALFLLDAVMIAYTPAVDLASAEKQQREVKSTFLSIVSTVFAFGVLLSNIAKSEKKRSSRSAQICITGLLLGLAFAIPSFDSGEGDGYFTHLLLSITKTVCVIAVGIFMSGIVLELNIVNKNITTE